VRRGFVARGRGAASRSAVMGCRTSCIPHSCATAPSCGWRAAAHRGRTTTGSTHPGGRRRRPPPWAGARIGALGVRVVGDLSLLAGAPSGAHGQPGPPAPGIAPEVAAQALYRGAGRDRGAPGRGHGAVRAPDLVPRVAQGARPPSATADAPTVSAPCARSSWPEDVAGDSATKTR